MVKTFLIASFLLALFTGCLNDNPLNPGHSEKEIPAWLQERISEISSDQFYAYSEVYRYEWNGDYVYHILAPISSCAFCELYSEKGNTLKLTTDEFADFVEHKKNKTLIWKWEDE